MRADDRRSDERNQRVSSHNTSIHVYAPQTVYYLDEEFLIFVLTIMAISLRAILAIIVPT